MPAEGPLPPQHATPDTQSAAVNASSDDFAAQQQAKLCAQCSNALDLVVPLGTIAFDVQAIPHISSAGDISTPQTGWTPQLRPAATPFAGSPRDGRIVGAVDAEGRPICVPCMRAMFMARGEMEFEELGSWEPASSSAGETGGGQMLAREPGSDVRLSAGPEEDVDGFRPGDGGEQGARSKDDDVQPAPDTVYPIPDRPSAVISHDERPSSPLALPQRSLRPVHTLTGDAIRIQPPSAFSGQALGVYGPHGESLVAGKGTHTSSSSFGAASRKDDHSTVSAYLLEKTREGWGFYTRPDPLLDMTRLRVPSTGTSCLYPGSIFKGTQRSGRNSYDVTVTILHVDIPASFLCGYLNIRGLTDDWPELTTYFDAEIIGSRYGFLTNKWGASERDDLKHWGQFPFFRQLRNHLSKPGLRFNHMSKPYIFMRWKERFLVPDHRVRDISGASFAGFYYVCVELGNSPSTIPTVSSPLASTSPPISPSLPSSTFSGVSSYARDATRPSSRARRSSQASSRSALGLGGDGSPTSLPSASLSSGGAMSGFYFHENSEQDQQLSLQHVPQRTSSSFELR